MRATDKKSTRTTAQQYADLKKLGDKLAGKDLKRSTDKNRKATVSRRKNELMDLYSTKRGGGQGKSAPKTKTSVNSMTRTKRTTRIK